MMANKYQIQFTSHAEKDLDKFRQEKDRERVIKKILILESNPLAGHTLKGSLKGVRALEFFLADGEYRAAYIVLENEKTCLVFAIGAHEGFYEKAERRAKRIS